MIYISRSNRLRFNIEDLLSKSSPRSELSVSLYSSEIRKIQKLYPELEIKKLSDSTVSNKYRCVITKR